ncbi:MAG: Glu-tRNA(Gln) amidotransferase subunit GatD [bacterium]|nr:Glu-tRNA(Gln) amidotransferase subunit GatD [bacterium]
MSEAAADPLKGYRGKARAVLESFGVRVWSEVDAETTRGKFHGIILPRAEQADEHHIVLKLLTGYNVGVAAENILQMKEVGYREANYQIPEKEFPKDPAKPNVTLLGTGGTIASRLDYRTGAVIPAFAPGELYGAVPELADICNLDTIKLYGIFSENIGPEHWIGTALAIEKELEKGVDGIVIGHGTDTMHYTAAALTFMVQDPPVPIVMVGSQRSSDRPSSDAALNLIHATQAAATGQIAEVMVCMFGPTSDAYALLHRGVRVRKMHSSYRSAFRTLSDVPLAKIQGETLTPIKEDWRPRDPARKPRIRACFEEKVGILYYYPNMQPDVLEGFIENGYKGIVIAGTGLGHVNKPLYPALEKARDAGIPMFMTVQTLWGFAQMYVYDTGRDIQERGVIPLANMLPEVAYVKLGWALGQTGDPAEVKRIMLERVSDEITDREPPNGYLILQGGLPEVDDYLKKYWK